MSADSTKRVATDNRPAKPHPGYPLMIRKDGRLAKKVNGRLYYFGVWGTKNGNKIVPVDDVQQALQDAADKWDEQKNDLYAGRTPSERKDALTVKECVNRYLEIRLKDVKKNKLSKRSFSEYLKTGEKVFETLGETKPVDELGIRDFERLADVLGEGVSAQTLAKKIQQVRTIFNVLFEWEEIDAIPKFGPGFKKPDAEEIRRDNQGNGKKHYEPGEIRMLLSAVSGDAVTTLRTDDDGNPVEYRQERDATLRAILLVCANCAFGSADIAELPISAVDLEGGWIDFPRPKTAIARRAKLWQETVDAIREYLEVRPQPLDPNDSDVLFLTEKGKRWLRKSDSDDQKKWESRTDLLGKTIGRLKRELGMNGKRSTYAFRHSFQRAGEETSVDLPAIACVMGHSQKGIQSHYRGRISDERLENLCDAVHGWVFGKNQNR